MTSNNTILFERAQRHIPGGVNSPVRAFGQVGGTPRFFTRGDGARLQDADGQWLIDYVGSWGPMIAGHAHPEVTKAVQQAAEQGLSFGAPTEREVEMAELLCQLVPSMDMVRLVSSGTEATMTAIRLARGYTGRDLLIKFEGGYHGHSDSLLVKAGSGALTLGTPSSAGVPRDLTQHTLVLDYNNPSQLKDAFTRHGERIAAVIVEPIAGNMNLIAPDPEFLDEMRNLTSQHGAVLIFDEVMTGFRVGLTGAQGLYGINPDLTTLGKIIGGGLPVGAVGGRREIMEKIAPLGPVYQAGTLCGNPVALAAGLATLKLIQAPGFYERLNQLAHSLCNGLVEAAHQHGKVLSAKNIGAMFGLYFAPKCPSSYNEALACDKTAFTHFFHSMLKAGHYFAPSPFEACFISSAHGEDDIKSTVQAASQFFSLPLYLDPEIAREDSNA